MEDFTNDYLDAEQQKNLMATRKLAVAILRRHLWLLGTFFVVLAVVLLAWLYRNGVTSPYRYETQSAVIFYPKSTPKVTGVDVNHILRLLSTRDIVQKAAENLNLNRVETAEMYGGLSVWQNRQQKNSFGIKVLARTEKDAVDRVNAFVDTAINEYVAFRLRDLADWRSTNEQRHAEIMSEMNKLDDEIIGLGIAVGASTTEYEERRIKSELALANSRYLELNLKYINEQSTVKRIEEEMANVDPAILNEVEELRRYTAKLNKLDERIDTLRQTFTEENPIYAGTLEERKRVEEEYRAFLKQFGMTQISDTELTRISQLSQEARASRIALEALQISVKVAEENVNRVKKSLDDLMDASRQVDTLRAKRDALRKDLLNIEERENDIRYLETSARNELVSLERASSAQELPVLSLKRFMAAIILAVVATMGLAFMTVFFGILFGKVFDYEELTFFWEDNALGEMEKLDDNDFEEIFYRFQNKCPNTGAVFVGLLPGTKPDKSIEEELMLKSTQAGLRTLMVHLTDAKSFKEPDGAVMYTALCCKDGRGYFPVANTRHLSSSELAILRADLSIMKNDFERVFITNDRPVPPKGVLLHEMLSVCEAVLLVAGKNRTSRASLRHVLDASKKDKTPTLMLLRSFQSLLLPLIAAALLCTGCYRNRFTDNYDQYPELESGNNDFMEKAELSEEEQERRYKILMEYEKEESIIEYRINPGDKLRITFYNNADLNTSTIVTPDGYIGMMFLGQLKVAGMSIRELTEYLEENLKKFIKYPTVGVSLEDISSETVTIAGAVAKPGTYLIANGMRLADLYAKAGGSDVRRYKGDDLDAADLANSSFVRDNKLLPVDFFAAIEQGQRPHNLKLKKGDYVFIGTRAEATVCLVGHIRIPQKHIWNKNMGLIELLTDGGWMEETYWPKVIIIRGGVANPRLYKVDVDAILAGKRGDVLLAPGDIVYVPHDNISEYNVFVRKLFPTGQLLNLLFSPVHYYKEVN